MRIAGSEDGKTLLPPVTIDTPQKCYTDGMQILAAAFP